MERGGCRETGWCFVVMVVGEAPRVEGIVL